MIHRKWLELFMLAGLLGWFTLPAASRASAQNVACRTSEDSNNSVLLINGFTHSNTQPVDYTIGNFPFFGASAVGACVLDEGTHTQTLYVITDKSGNLLGWLPKIFNHLCLTSSRDNVNVVTTPISACGVTFSPLNYNGNVLTMYGQAGGDQLIGGNGVDVLYGGSGNDYVDDGVHSSTSSYGELYGEDDNDLLFGSVGNATFLSGGSGNDGVRDYGGTADVLHGDAGNECCMWDSNDRYNEFDCGTGTDTVRSLSGGTFAKTRCEQTSSNCGGQAPPDGSCFAFP